MAHLDGKDVMIVCQVTGSRAHAKIIVFGKRDTLCDSNGAGSGKIGQGEEKKGKFGNNNRRAWPASTVSLLRRGHRSTRLTTAMKHVSHCPWSLMSSSTRRICGAEHWHIDFMSDTRSDSALNNGSSR